MDNNYSVENVNQMQWAKKKSKSKSQNKKKRKKNLKKLSNMYPLKVRDGLKCFGRILLQKVLHNNNK
jgi:hypothetical protein